MSIIWVNDPHILFKKLDLNPFNKEINSIEYYNSLTRLMIIIILLLVIIERCAILILIPLGIILYIYKLFNEEEKFENFIGEKCQAPSLDNPFMNGLAGDNPTRPEACKSPATEELSKTYLDHNLYKDVNDVFEKHNSQRQFYTNPSTTYPNDREAFMKWCWDTPYACKAGDMNHCLQYEDLRVPGFS